MPLVWTLVGIALLLALVLVVRLDALFALLIALLIAAAAVGLLNGMGPVAVLDAVQRGVRATMGGVVLVLVFGAMLGKMLDESGAAQVIVRRLAAWFGPGRAAWAMAAAGLLVGLPMLYNAGFLVLIPLVYALARATREPLASLGVPAAGKVVGNATVALFAGAFAQVLKDAGVADYVARRAGALGWNPLTVRQTFATWGVMEMVVALAGLGAALLLQLVL